MTDRFDDIFADLPKQTQELLQQRYGAKRRNYWQVAALLILALGLPWLMWSAWHHSNPSARITLVSFKPIDARSIEIKFELIRRDPGVAQLCTLIARDFDKNIVGEIDVTIPATPDKQSLIITEVIPTRLEAVNAGVLGCEKK